MSDSIVETVACPACGAAVGVSCRTIVDGVDIGWTHDARILAPIRAELRAAREGQP